MHSARARRVSLAAALCVATAAVAACGSANSAGPGTPRPTAAGVGSLPPGFEESADVTPLDVVETGPSVDITTTVPPEGASLAELADGNKILLIGDSIMSSISRRYGNQACELLVPQGWRVAVEAEKSRPVGFGLDVLDRVLDDGWDAFVILLGNNYGKNQETFRSQLEEMLDEIGDHPVLLLTVTEFEPVQREVNDVIRAVAAARANIVLLDWAQITEERALLGRDGLHLTEQGREALATHIAAVAGSPEGDGECIGSKFTDDSAGDQVGGGSQNSGGDGGSSGGNRGTTATTKPKPVVTTTPVVTVTSPPFTTVTAPPSSNTSTPTSSPTTDPPSTQSSPPTTQPVSSVVTTDPPGNGNGSSDPL